MDFDLSKVQVVHNEKAHRFEASVGEYLALAAYFRDGNRMVIHHTEVPVPLERKGLAGKIASAALDFARAQKLVVVPQCPYIAHYIRQHKEYQDLLAP